MLINEEWYLETPFGKVAMISWGKRHLPPVLLVHGFADTAAMFIPLVRQLPDTHYYVSFDFPGLFYHHVFPGKMKNMINLDPYFALLRYHMYATDDSLWYKVFYEKYYNRFERCNEPPVLLTYDKLVRKAMEQRNLSYDLAELMLSRNLVDVEPGMYRNNTQSAIIKLVQLPVFEDTLEYIITLNKLPKLNINASETKEKVQTITFLSNILRLFDDPTSKHILSVHVSGGHDVHVTNPERLVPHIAKFLAEEDNDAIVSKL